MSIVLSEGYGYPTSRRYARTLREAFPSAEDCVAVTHYRRPLRSVGWVVAWFALCVLIGALIGSAL